MGSRQRFRLAGDVVNATHDRIRVAFVKLAGMAAGGTERWLQTMAANLPSDRFEVTYFWCDAPPVIGGQGQMGDATDPARLDYLRAHGIETVQFRVDAVDLRHPTFPWRGTDFWELFDPESFDLVQTSKQGVAEYPFDQMPIPVFEQVAYNGGVDTSPAIVRSSHPSEWSRAWWWRHGGELHRSFVVRIPASGPASANDLREILDIPRDAIVVGFHQRPDPRTFSDVQLAAVARLRTLDVHVVVLGGSDRYKEQAEQLGLERVHFLPAVSDQIKVSEFLNTLDVFTHGRRDGETFGLVLAEAIAHGVPCISHRVPGNGNAQRETIGPAGFVCDGVEHYARVLADLVSDPIRRRVLSERGVDHAMEWFDVRACVADLADEYETFMKGRNPLGRRKSYGEISCGVLVQGDVLDPSSNARAIVTGGSVPCAIGRALLEFPLDEVMLVGASLVPVAVTLAQHREEGCPEIFIDDRDPAVGEAVHAELVLNACDHRVVVRSMQRWDVGLVPPTGTVVIDPDAVRSILPGSEMLLPTWTAIVGVGLGVAPAAEAEVVTLGATRWMVCGPRTSAVCRLLRRAARRERRQQRRVSLERVAHPLHQRVVRSLRASSARLGAR